MNNKFVTAVLPGNQVILSRDFFTKLVKNTEGVSELNPTAVGLNSKGNRVSKYEVNGVTLWSELFYSPKKEDRKSKFTMSSSDIEKVYNELPTLEVPTF